MANTQLQLPVIQNWSCHNCGGCCREHQIDITEAEKIRIERQGWNEQNLDFSGPFIIQSGKKSYRLAHRDDGACVFLDDRGLCRIHAEYGEPAKPLACRVYPYAWHPAGKNRTATSLRFSCPSVVQNLGTAVTGQKSDLLDLVSDVLADVDRDFDPPLIHHTPPHGPQEVSWADFRQFVEALDVAFSDQSVHFAVRLMRVLAWLELVEQSQFETIQAEKLSEYLALVTEASVKAQPDNELPVHRPGRLGRTLFRLITAQYMRHDTEADRRQGMSRRLELASAAIKFTLGRGTVPRLATSSSVETAFRLEAPLADVRFERLEGAFAGRTEEIDSLFERYFRVKIQGLHFCGPANFQASLVAGFRSLALMYPVVLWIARIRCVGRGGERLQLSDVQAALAIADHNFAYSPALGTPGAMKRIAMLSRMKQLTALAGWYSL